VDVEARPVPDFLPSGANAAAIVVTRRVASRSEAVIETETFTPDEWWTLRFAPFWVLSAVVGRTRSFDPLDLEAFSHAVDVLADQERGRLGGAVLTRVALDIHRLTSRYSADRRSVATGLWEVSGLLTRLPEEEAEAFRDALVSGVGESVAKARGPYGRVMSEDDARKLALVAQLLS
jgi:hypothetical protein